MPKNAVTNTVNSDLEKKKSILTYILDYLKKMGGLSHISVCEYINVGSNKYIIRNGNSIKVSETALSKCIGLNTKNSKSNYEEPETVDSMINIIIKTFDIQFDKNQKITKYTIPKSKSPIQNITEITSIIPLTEHGLEKYEGIYKCYYISPRSVEVLYIRINADGTVNVSLNRNAHFEGNIYSFNYENSERMIIIRYDLQKGKYYRIRVILYSEFYEEKYLYGVYNGVSHSRPRPIGGRIRLEKLPNSQSIKWEDIIKDSTQFEEYSFNNEERIYGLLDRDLKLLSFFQGYLETDISNNGPFGESYAFFREKENTLVSIGWINADNNNNLREYLNTNWQAFFYGEYKYTDDSSKLKIERKSTVSFWEKGISLGYIRILSNGSVEGKMLNRKNKEIESYKGGLRKKNDWFIFEFLEKGKKTLLTIYTKLSNTNDKIVGSFTRMENDDFFSGKLVLQKIDEYKNPKFISESSLNIDNDEYKDIKNVKNLLIASNSIIRVKSNKLDDRFQPSTKIYIQAVDIYIAAPATFANAEINERVKGDLTALKSFFESKRYNVSTQILEDKMSDIHQAQSQVIAHDLFNEALDRINHSTRILIWFHEVLSANECRQFYERQSSISIEFGIAYQLKKPIIILKSRKTSLPNLINGVVDKEPNIRCINYEGNVIEWLQQRGVEIDKILNEF